MANAPAKTIPPMHVLAIVFSYQAKPSFREGHGLEAKVLMGRSDGTLGGLSFTAFRTLACGECSGALKAHYRRRTNEVQRTSAPWERVLVQRELEDWRCGLAG
jgi:hypothetical protein